MKPTTVKLFIIAIALFAANSAFAALSYTVSVDTSFLTNYSNAYLFYSFGPGFTDTTPAASATVSGLNGISLVSVDYSYGALNGDTPSNFLTLNNNSSDGIAPSGVIYQANNFSSILSYNLNFTGGQAAGDPQNGNVFSFSMFSKDDTGGYMPMLTEDGLLFNIALNTDGTATTDFFSNKVSVSSSVTLTPIPGAVWLFGSGLIGLVGIRRVRA